MGGNLLDDAFVAELAELVRHKRRNGLWGGMGIAGVPSSIESFPGFPILVKNTEAEEIPAYACMQISDMLSEDGRNYVEVEKPDGNGATYLFAGDTAIPSEGYGVGYAGPIVRGFKNTGTVTEGDRWAPSSGQWYLAEGPGPFVAIGLDDIDDDVFRLSISPSSVRLYRFTLNAALSGGTAAADIIEMDGTDTGIDDTVRDPEGIFTDLTTDDTGLCILQDGKYYVIQAPCPT